MILSVYNSLIELVNKEFKDICEDADIMFSNVVSSKIPDDPISALKYSLLIESIPFYFIYVTRTQNTSLKSLIIVK